MKPTVQHANNYQALFDYLNKELFQGQVGDCFLTMIPTTYASGGYFNPDKWHDADGNKLHELNMNPNSYAVENEERFVSILAHEMCHVWINDTSEKPPRGGYHCKKWGAKMKEIGLYPSNTGEPGGKETGQQMTHYIMEEGLFKEVFDRMDKDLLLPFKRYQESQTDKKKKKKKNKIKYSCPNGCMQVWGKPGLRVICGACEEELETPE